jgi:hypothetical protein
VQAAEQRRVGRGVPQQRTTGAPQDEVLHGYVAEKIEGFAVTDNDGVDDSSGETDFFSIGKM